MTKNETVFKNKNSSNLNFFYSSDYWEKRYANGGNSGSGSYNNLAKFKAEIINNFLNINKIKTVIEWGSGDCNQISLINYKQYIGYDVSKTAIDICKKKFYNDSTKMFLHINDKFINKKKADLSVSLDVIFHLLEDNVYNLYMKNLFDSSEKFICIYSSNYDKTTAKHVKHRKFTDWIDKYQSNIGNLKNIFQIDFPSIQKNAILHHFLIFIFMKK